MDHQWLREIGAWAQRHKTLLGAFSLAVVVMGFFIVEHARGSVSLARYKRALSARGEKLSAREFRLLPASGENGAPEVLVAATELNAGVILPNTHPPRMVLTPAGHGVICFQQVEWVENKVTNHWEQLAEDLEANRATLKRIAGAMAKPVLDCEFDPSLGPRARFPHLLVPKTLAHWFGSSVQLGLHEGRPREVVEDLLSEIDLPRFLARDGIVISELVRDAVGGVATVDTWEALQADRWTDDDLARIQQAWERQGFLTNIVRALEGERVFAQCSYDLMRKSNEETEGVLYGMEAFLGAEDRPSWERWLRDLPGGEATADFLKKKVYCPLWRLAWLDQDQLRYLQYLEQLIALGRQAGREQSLRKLAPAVDDLILKFESRGSYDRLRYPSVMSVATLSRVFVRAMRAETERSLVLTAIALKRYQVRHGEAPQSLSALVPEFLPSVPVDYMDGGSLRYRRQPEGGFLLYSVGEDGKDDGGDASLPPGKTNLRMIWERKDMVWPAPATADEAEAYQKN
ncbi:MAG TPA: hypothetical protein VJA21_18605 [Verrucomicrobiae bacterium]